MLSASVGTAIIGKLGDMYGKQRLLVWTLLILAAGTLLGALSGTLAVLIVARVVQGVGGGIFAATFVAASTVHGLPALAGFTTTFAMAALFLACCAVAGLLVPAPALALPSLQPAATADTG